MKRAPFDINPKVMTVKEVSELLKIHTQTVYRLVKEGQLPAFKVGRDLRFNVEDLNRWLEERKNTNKVM